MAGVTIDTLGTLFINYLPGVTQTLNNEVTLRRNALKSNKKWTGEKIEFRIHVARNPAIGYVEDAGALPVAGKQDYVAATVGRRFMVGSVQASDGGLAVGADTKNAAIDTATSELRGMMEGLMKFENYMGFRDGTGVVATCGTDVAAPIIGVDDARCIWDKVKLEAYDTTLAAQRVGVVTVTSVARAADANGDRAVTTSSLPAGLIATDKLVWPGSLNRAITGLDKLIGTGTIQGVNTTTYPRWTSIVLDNGGTDRPLTPTLFRQMLAAIRQESGKKAAVYVHATNWSAIEVEELYEPVLQIKPDTKVGGAVVASFQSVFGRINIEPDVDCPYGKMFFVDYSQVSRAVNAELDWRRGKDGSIFRPSDQALVYRANAVEIAEYFIEARNRCGKITDLAENIATAY